MLRVSPVAAVLAALLIPVKADAQNAPRNPTAGEPTYAEAVQFIKENLQTWAQWHLSVVTEQGYKFSDLHEFTYSGLEFGDDCTMRFTASQKRTIDGENIKDLPPPFRFSSWLRDLDPLEIGVDAADGFAWVWKPPVVPDASHVMINRELWLLAISRSTDVDYSDKGKIGFYATDRERAKRVAKALQHAVLLCGGKVKPW